jgi:glycosyltransferase involved in cell wall biosynthesis
LSQLPLISIVIPHFNRTELLAETLASVRAQEYSNWEVVIVDDGSEESEWAAVQAMAGEPIRVLRREDGQKGPSRCRNLGAAVAAGEFIIFVDSDDIMAPWCLSARMEAVAQHSEPGFWVFPVLLFRRQPGDLATCWNRLEGDEDLDRFLRSDPPWHTSSPVWRKSAFVAIGGFNERVIYGDDAHLHARALLHSIHYRKFPDHLPDVFIRRGDEQRITNQWSASLIELRKVRLLEGTALLERMNAAKERKDIWEGQYFVEGEELLFNVDGSKKAIQDVIAAWLTTYRPGMLRRQVARTYFKLGLLCRKHAYLLLRISRRLAMLVLPAQFFPMGGEFHRWEVSKEVLQAVRDGLASGSSEQQVAEPNS